MADDWRPLLIERLVGAANAAGAWGYRADSSGAAEPTALAALALAAAGQRAERCERALAWLAQFQQEDGAVPVSAQAPAPHWPTALVLLAWLGAGADSQLSYGPQIERALTWLLHARGRKLQHDRSIVDHDTTLVGWPWVAHSHSWIEPTAYAILALRACSQGEHPRVREAVRLIFDRALPDGGWNYGNRRVFGHVLRPFLATTGIALAALAGEPRDPRISAAVKYLETELPHVRAPLSLAWGLIGLRAWNAAPEPAEAWLRRSAGRLSDGPVHPHYAALLLLAGAGRIPLLKLSEAHAYG